jgi:hypothetical protein
MSLTAAERQNALRFALAQEQQAKASLEHIESVLRDWERKRREAAEAYREAVAATQQARDALNP